MDNRGFMIPLHRVYICVMMVMLLSLSGCKHPGGAGHISEQMNTTDTVPPNSQAFEMMKAGEPYEEYMAVQMEAVAQLRDGHPRSDAIDILAQTGHFLIRHGHYIDALEYMQEASDSARIRMNNGMVDGSMARMHASLGALYCRFGLFDEALDESAMAIKISALRNFIYATDIWRMRGATYAALMEGSENKTVLADSILYCINRAYSYIPQADKDMQEKYYDRCDFDKAALFVENADLFSDSIDRAIDMLRPMDATGSSAVSRNVLLGRAYVLTGRYDDGIELMEKGLDLFRKQNWKESEEWALQLLAQSYSEAGRGRELAEIYPQVKAARDNMMNQTKLNTLVGADFKYRLREKQRQVEILQEKNARAGKIIILGGVILIFGLLVGAVLAVTYIKLKSKSRRERIMHKKEISDILSHQVALNNKIEQLNEQLEQKESDNVIDNVVGQLNPALLSGDDETKFRRAFVSLHPHFLKKLRRDYPELTSGDELLCMLIYLKVPPIDMAASLGISRSSLNSARYRLRKRLNLDKSADLDIFIQSQ